jgi:hypothetical protein
MNQIISILDSYAYRALVWDIYVERVSRPARGAAPDEQRIAASLPRAEICLAVISGLMDEAPGSPASPSAWPTCTRLQCSRFSDWLPRANVCSMPKLGSGGGGSASARVQVSFAPKVPPRHESHAVG